MRKHCLIIHGLGGRPFEMEYIAAKLEMAGIEPHLILLPGHGGALDEYERSRFADWAEHVEREYAAITASGICPAIVGFSLGGLLALHLAARNNPAGAAILASPLRLASYNPFFMADWRIFLLPLLGRVLRKIEESPASPEARALAPWQGHSTIFPPQLLDLERNTRELEKELGKVNCPLLLMQDYNDRTCNKWNTWRIAEKCSSSDVTIKLCRIKNRRAGRHLIVTHTETKEIVAAEIVAFINRLPQKFFYKDQ